MTNNPQKTEQHPSRSRRRVKRLCLVAAIALMAAAICALFLLRDRRSADERLAEIEAARAIPDTQNAARIYNDLLEDPHAMSLPNSLPDAFWNGPGFYQRRDAPWRTEDCPELAAWIEGCTPIIDRLAEASQLDACRFRITIDIFDLSAMERTSSMGLWAFLLTFAANNDLAENRPDAAVPKWRCLIQMGNHLRQQPCDFDHMEASLTTELTLKSMARFVATGHPAPKHLQDIEAMPLPLADDWQHHLKQIRLIEDLTTRKTRESLSLSKRLTSSLSPRRMKRVLNRAFGPDEETTTKSIGKRYRQNIAVSRGLHILTALRRHRTLTGQWPQGLHEIKASVPETLWTDPLNGDPFIYRRLQDSFELYSKGLNGIDDRGRADPNGPDDIPIWIPPPPTEKEMFKQLKKIYGDRYRGLLYDQNDPKQPDPNDV